VLDSVDELLFTFASKIKQDVVINTLKTFETYFSDFIKKAIKTAKQPLTWSQAE